MQPFPCIYTNPTEYQVAVSEFVHKILSVVFQLPKDKYM